LNSGDLINDKYKIVEKIGVEGAEEIYKAKWLLHNENVLIKLINQQQEPEGEFRTHFINEAELLSKLEHKNIVRVLDIINEPALLGLVMELPSDKTLHQITKTSKGKISLKKTFPLFMQILEAMEYAHQNGVWHRNLRPENIFVSNTGEIKISGFSIPPIDGAAGKAKSRIKKEAMYYLPPEQITRERIDERADIYSAGIIFYEVIAGTLPFGNKGNVNEFSLMTEILNNPFLDPRQFNPAIPVWLVELLKTATAKKKEERLKSFSNFLVLFKDGEADFLRESQFTVTAEIEPIKEIEKPHVPEPTVEVKKDKAEETFPGKKILSFKDAKSYQRKDDVSEISLAPNKKENKKSVKPIQPKKRKKRKGLKFLLILAILSAAGYYGYLNLPPLEPISPKLKSTLLESGYTSGVQAVAFSPDGNYVAGGTEGETVNIWEMFTGNEVNTLEGHNNVMSVAFSHDGKYLASGSRDKSIKVWNFTSGEEYKTLPGHSGWVYSVAFSPDGKFLASGSNDKLIFLWEVAAGEKIKTFSGHRDGVASVAFSPDGKFLASGSMDNTLKLWDVETGKAVQTFSAHAAAVYAVAFSPDGKYLASGSHDAKIIIWDILSGKEITTLTGHSRSVNSIAFSPDGKLLASGSDDYSIKLWSTSTWKELNTLTGQNYIMSIAFSPDSKLLASGSEENNIKLWAMNSAKELTPYQQTMKRIELLYKKLLKYVQGE